MEWAVTINISLPVSNLELAARKRNPPTRPMMFPAFIRKSIDVLLVCVRCRVPCLWILIAVASLPRLIDTMSQQVSWYSDSYLLLPILRCSLRFRYRSFVMDGSDEARHHRITFDQMWFSIMVSIAKECLFIYGCELCYMHVT